MYISPDIENQLNNYLNSDSVPEGSLDYLACHGFLTAMAVYDDVFVCQEILPIITDTTPEFDSSEQQEVIESALDSLFIAISRGLYLGEDFTLPMSLKPPKTSQTNDLTDWCFGFMEAVAVFEDDWFSSQATIDQIAELILPITVFSEPHVDPDLAHLVKNEQSRTRLAAEIPENLQQLYLLFRD